MLAQFGAQLAFTEMWCLRSEVLGLCIVLSDPFAQSEYH